MSNSDYIPSRDSVHVGYEPSEIIVHANSEKVIDTLKSVRVALALKGHSKVEFWEVEPEQIGTKSFHIMIDQFQSR